MISVPRKIFGNYIYLLLYLFVISIYLRQLLFVNAVFNRKSQCKLDLLQTASTPEIRKAYRRLSLQLHPDKNKDENAEESFRQVCVLPVFIF